MLLRLAIWAPRRPAIPIGGGILAMVPAAIALAIGRESFQNLWLMDDLTTKYEGLSSRGFAMIAVAAAGALLVIFSVLATLGRAAAARARPATASRMRVFSPSEDARGETKLAGIARRASVEIASAVSDEPCLVFGIRGEVGDVDISDAEGGDFDLELPSGERVMISLEHALLRVATPPRPQALVDEIGSALEELLENRGIPDVQAGAVLEEHLVRDGDEVTVTGTLLGGTVTSLGYRGSSRSRVLAGEEDRPLIVERLGHGSET